ALQVMAGTQSGFIYHVTVHPSSMSSRLICENHSNGVLSVAFAAQHSDRFATISKDCTIRIWDGSDYSVVVRMAVQNAGMPTCLAFSLGEYYYY
ncbi:hypothetical protein AaE_014865, partial [Aphanomyces astaci]